MERAATMDNPAPDNDASVRSLGIFLLTRVNNMYTIKVLLKVQKKKKRKRHTDIHKLFIKFTSRVVVSVLIKFPTSHFKSSNHNWRVKFCLVSY